MTNRIFSAKRILGGPACHFLTLLLFLLPVEIMALNGLRPIGVSAAARSLGGTGVASYYNFYEAIYRNPSLMAKSPLDANSFQASFGMTFGDFKPRVKATYGSDQEFKTPSNKTSALFPSVFGFGHKINSKISWGLGLYGGGGGADYTDAQSIYRSKSRTAALSLIPGISYDFGDGLSIGLNTSFTYVDVLATNDSVTTGRRTRTGGSDYTYGFLLATSLKRGNFVYGASFSSPVTAVLENARDIDEDGEQDDLSFTAIPLEYSVGVSYHQPFLRLHADYRFMQWSESQFLKSVGWRDQHVIAAGMEIGNDHRIRIGLNMATDAVVDNFDQDGFATTITSNKPLINLAGDAFVATSGIGVTTQHITAGSYHELTKTLSLESAMVYMLPNSIERSGTYRVPTGRKAYGWRSEFEAFTAQLELSFAW